MAAPSAATAIEAFVGGGKAEELPPIVLLERVENGQDGADGSDRETVIASSGKAPAGAGGSHSISPRERAKNAAFNTAPERIAPEAPLPEP